MSGVPLCGILFIFAPMIARLSPLNRIESILVGLY